MTIFTRLSVVAAMAALLGCYNADEPLTPKPTATLDPAVSGEWRCLSATPQSDSKAGSLVLASLPDRRYSATLQGDEEKPEQYEVFASQLARSRIAANVRIGASLGVKEWAVMRCSLVVTPDLLLVDYLEGQGLPQGPGAKLNEALRRRWDEPGVFKPYLVCARTKPVGGGERPRNSDGRRSPGAGGSGRGEETFLFGDQGPQLSSEAVDVVWIG